MRTLNENELDMVAGGKLPDEDLQDMRDRNPNADNWKQVMEQEPPERMCTPDECWDVEPGYIPIEPIPYPG